MAIEISWSDHHFNVVVGTEEERETLIAVSKTLYNEVGSDSNPLIADLSHLHLIPKIIKIKIPVIKD